MKKKYLLKSKFLYFLYLFYLGSKYKYFTKKNSYSQFGEDLIINNFFGNFVGTYVDIGCYHPIKYSNTALLHKKAMSTIDKMVSKGHLKKNTAARRKSKISKHLNSLS